ncbi:hypothetical protein BMS3Abin07_01231 [bacterium BMS3Abin07]|nr:hypothetical protein BMS3Abin07_01231 [bacterium BMS3Abin07]GBE33199.1 hypothetical protein BMS3Bbin05_02137 [bacterium BMS3Bbin05]HDL20466.1 rubrerythrin family protein [Nitrospirota bacterium]HDO22317.1 rubrerythrin family protein [Nitrospirota bacterium]HDZ88481.1 rubrerythrin family protein [Nitrospirota bacterium]
MDKDFTLLMEESTNLELNVADLYLLFNSLFPEDSNFWWELALEEKSHAALIRSGKDFFEPKNQFPHDLLADSLQTLKDINSKLNLLIKKYKDTSPSREEAFNIAFKLENSASELHYQNFMSKETSSRIDNIFKQLNKDDKDHAMRICSYMENHGIPLQSKNG